MPINRSVVIATESPDERTNPLDEAVRALGYDEEFTFGGREANQNNLYWRADMADQRGCITVTDLTTIANYPQSELLHVRLHTLASTLGINVDQASTSV